ncbi:MAG: cyclic nucleotide-binding domain-containing protein [Chloroflexi bacterium]|nr:cyclic nucleotide-binding domain-containing protein [Chloroflexota bacterium]
MSISSVLAQSTLFSALDKQQLQRVAHLGTRETQAAETTLFHEGDKLQRLYIIERGSVKLTTDVRLWDGSGTLQSIVSIIEGGGTFGWSALIWPNLATLAAHSREQCSLITINGQELIHLLDDDPLMGYRVMKALATLVARRLDTARSIIMSERAMDVQRHPVPAF